MEGTLVKLVDETEEGRGLYCCGKVAEKTLLRTDVDDYEKFQVSSPLVEPGGFEPPTSCVQSRCSPN